MATTLAIDHQLVTEAQAIGGAPTKKAAVTEALEEYIQRRKQIEITSLFGKVDYDRDYDYKKTRSRKSCCPGSPALSSSMFYGRSFTRSTTWR